MYDDVLIEMKYPQAVQGFDKRIRDWNLKRNFYLRELHHIQSVTGQVKAYFEDSILFQKEFGRMRKQAQELAIKRKLAFYEGNDPETVNAKYQQFLAYVEGNGVWDMEAGLVHEIV